MSNMVVRTNILAMNSHRNMGIVGNQQANASARLSSGFRINSAADDAAGLGISENMRSQIRSLNQASRNTQDAISLIQTAEGALGSIADMIVRIRELNVQGANETNTQEDRYRIAEEVFQISREIRDMEGRVQFNGINILDTREANDRGMDGLHFQVGANSSQMIAISLNLDSFDFPYDTDLFSLPFILSSMLNHTGLALQGAAGNNPLSSPPSSFNYSGDNDRTHATHHQGGGLLDFGPGHPQQNRNIHDRSQTEWITAMISNVDGAFHSVTAIRGGLGALQNRLEFTMQNLNTSSENLSSANSRIRDADMAREMMRLTQANVLQQAATAMLSQGNQAPQSILQLLA